ncbi:hypothetical protein AJ80_05704 [Polytolypa hystricis UAMH7299]|uniref:F-box domain-containing protein n=1 Tax=Polytolypa hystricis (strain UAMH7299) TaxID=1447883 RepID=A0A2B7Y1M7_POLH7|nr:hypothetical protein AJ80_05704 [Polytolypa hystricis UAMH7299]
MISGSPPLEELQDPPSVVPPKPSTECHTWKPFKIPKELRVYLPFSTESRVLHLPDELILDIFAAADDMDQLCLALTCKRLLNISSRANVTVPRPNPGRQPMQCGFLNRFLRQYPAQSEHFGIYWWLCWSCAKWHSSMAAARCKEGGGEERRHAVRIPGGDWGMVMDRNVRSPIHSDKVWKRMSLSELIRYHWRRRR